MPPGNLSGSPFTSVGTYQVTVQTTGTYEITAYGAQGGGGANGGTGGLGAEVGGEFVLTAGTTLDILVGGAGSGSYHSGGGGGGSFVIEAPPGGTGTGTKLVIAGGGGGGYYNSSTTPKAENGGSGQTSGSGHAGYTLDGAGPGAGGSSGGGGDGVNGSGGGGGYSGNGSGNYPGYSFQNGGAGGQYNGPMPSGGNGGFGGGGYGEGGGGGGGGYSGGGTGYNGAGGGGGSYDGGSYQVLVAGEHGGNGRVVIDLLCYLRGTHILTPTGEAFVENLRIGDSLVTRFGGIRKVKWIGRQSFDARFVAGNRDHLPVCIRAGALGERLPARDLYVSPGHSMLIGGQLVLARALVNGVTITQDWSPPEIQYYQIELDSHDCVIAEGTWSETFADGPGLREQFHNAAEFAALYPDHAPPDEVVLCAPRPERGAKLDAVVRTVAARLSVLAPGPLRGSIDRVCAPWTIEGWAQDMAHPELPVLLEVLLADRVIATALACDYRGDLERAGIGQGRCAFFLTSPVRLRPEMLGSLRIRRAADGADLPMSESCREGVAAQAAKAPAGLRLVA